MVRKAVIPEIVDRQTLCEFMQFSSSRIHQLTELGLPRAEHGKYPFKQCVQWTIDHYRQSAPKRREGGSTEQARKYLYEQNAEKYRLENSVRRGELIELEDVRQFLLLLTTTLASRLEGLPARLTHSPEQREKLLDECRTVRTEVARAIESFEFVEAPSEADDAPTDTQRSGVGGGASDNAAGDTDSRAVA